MVFAKPYFQAPTAAIDAKISLSQIAEGTKWENPFASEIVDISFDYEKNLDLLATVKFNVDVQAVRQHCSLFDLDKLILVLTVQSDATKYRSSARLLVSDNQPGHLDIQIPPHNISGKVKCELSLVVLKDVNQANRVGRPVLQYSSIWSKKYVATISGVTPQVSIRSVDFATNKKLKDAMWRISLNNLEAPDRWVSVDQSVVIDIQLNANRESEMTDLLYDLLWVDLQRQAIDMFMQLEQPDRQFFIDSVENVKSAHDADSVGSWAIWLHGLLHETFGSNFWIMNTMWNESANRSQLVSEMQSRRHAQRKVRQRNLRRTNLTERVVN